MVSGLTKKVKEEIVTTQINHMKDIENSNLIDYSILEKYLMEGIFKYSPKKERSPPQNRTKGIKTDELNKEIDYKLFRKISGELGGNTFIRIFQAAKLLEDLRLGKFLKNSKLVEFYNYAEQDIIKNNYALFSIRNYSSKSHRVLELYLMKKGLVKKESYQKT
ncbi:MAG: hypothetical protein ACP5NZ_04735 [Nanobdellota archaeon]